MNTLSRRLTIYIYCIVSMCILTSCNALTTKPVQSPEKLLQSFGIDEPSEFASLSTCEQIKIYTEIGSQFLDIDHAVAIVPSWVNDEISNQPKSIVSVCIAEQGELLLGQLRGTYDTENMNNVYKIHSLIYLAADLEIINNNQIEQFVLAAICDERVYYRERIAILYYGLTQPDLQNFPHPSDILIALCD